MDQTKETLLFRFAKTKNQSTQVQLSIRSKVGTSMSTSSTIKHTSSNSPARTGVPSFTKVADSPEFNAGALSVGHGTVTSLNDQPGTGLVWVSDVEGLNLRIYNGVLVSGNLTPINSFDTPGTTKFTRPVFGDGVVY